MSFGNTNDQSNKGNNAPWQRALLKLFKNISITATVTLPKESLVTTDPVYSAEAVGSQTLTGLNAAVAAWKAANPDRKVVRETGMVAGDGQAVIYISHIA